VRVSIDARELTGQPTGVGRYLAELLAAWQADPVAQRHEWRLVAHATPSRLPAGWPGDVHVAPGDGGTRWEQWELPGALARVSPDVHFAPGYTAPLTAPAPVVLAVHDVSFCAHPEWFTWREGTRRRYVTAWSARRARLVLAPSAFSAREIVTHLGVLQDRLRIVPLGVRRPAGPVAEGRAPVVLFVGSLFQRRRIDVLIEAFAAVAAVRPDARLEIVGANRTRPHVDFAAMVDSRGLRDRVRLRHWVDEPTLEAVYSEASVFVFLSQYEGFGFTPLEAMAHGAVPIVLDTPVAREVCGAAAWRVDDGPGLTGAVAHAITTLLDGGPERQRLRDASRAVLASYQWADTARRVLRALEEAAGA
jgi:glycosyltransferase involved in cell wall biosynthesis